MNGEIVAIIGDPNQHEKEIREIAVDAANRGLIPITPFALWPVDTNNALTFNFATRERNELMRNWARAVLKIATLAIVVNLDNQTTPEMDEAITIMSTINMLFVVDPNKE